MVTSTTHNNHDSQKQLQESLIVGEQKKKGKKNKKNNLTKETYKICEEERHIRNMSPCFQVRGLHSFPNRLLLIPQRDANTAARMSMYMAKLLCCVLCPVRSMEGPATSPATNALHFAVLFKNLTIH